MRSLACIMLGSVLAISASAQTMTEFGAAAAGGTVGGAAGKKVSEGVTAIFGKVDQQAKAAAKDDQAKADKRAATAPTAMTSAPTSTALPTIAPASGPAPAPISKSGPARAAKRAEQSSVPDPPALPARAAVASKAPEPAPTPAVEVAPAVPPPPPPPEMTAEDLKSIVPGATREDVLKVGVPSSRLTMFGDEGHLLEIYSYVTKGVTFGVVRLSDGSVSKVELR
jgi:hypothetical protein